MHLGTHQGKVYLVPRPEEKLDHLAMKLAAYVMFLPQGPIVEPSPDHPALHGMSHRPDVCLLDEGGRISTWIECGFVSLHKLDKVTRRLPQGRIIVIKSTVNEAERLRNDMVKEVKKADRVEIWTWPQDSFREWMMIMGEKTEIFGDAAEGSLNVVVNENPYVVEMVKM
jgi:hypothetical protein